MKRSNYFFLLLPCLAFMACDEDDPDPNSNLVPDTVAPAVTIIAPEANDSILVIDVIEVIAEVTDDKQLDNVRVVLAAPDWDGEVVSDIPITNFSDHKKYTAYAYYPVPKFATKGEYTVRVEAKDKGRNITSNDVTFILYAPSLNNAAFERPFANTLLHSNISEILVESGYNHWDQMYSFDEPWFSYVLDLMVSTENLLHISEAEWAQFIADFGLKNQSWAQWDENSDGNLNDEEFKIGINNLKLFNDWDKNQNSLVSYEEMAAGIFALWDHNQDNLLSTEEYQEKFYTYLYR